MYRFLSLVLIPCVFACISSEIKDKENNSMPNVNYVEAVDSILKQAAVGKLDARKLDALVSDMIKYANQNPKNDLSPIYLYKAADILKNVLNKKEQAMRQYEKVYEKYPEHKNAPLALMSHAFLLDTEYANIVEARKKYKLFLDRYPDHELADDAELSIKYLGRDEEEILKEILKQDSLSS